MLAGTRIDQIPDAATLDLVADSAVNHGPAKAIKWLQTALHITVDGIIGPHTLAAMNAMDSDGDSRLTRMFILRQRIQFYGAIVVSDPTQLRFLSGWLNRAVSFLT
jgi:lysozyme family protein